MVSAFDADVRHRGAFERRKQDSPQAVAHGRAEAALERLSGEFSIRLGRNMLIANYPRGEFKTTPSDSHCSDLLAPSLNCGRFPPPPSGAICSPASPGGA